MNANFYGKIKAPFVGQRGADNGAPLITDRTGQELKTAAQTTLKAQKSPTGNGNRRLKTVDCRLEAVEEWAH